MSWLLAVAPSVGKVLVDSLLVPVLARAARMPLDYFVRPIWTLYRRLGGGGDGPP